VSGAAPDRWLELLTVTAANLAATAVKFLLFRLVVFRHRPAAAVPAPGAPDPSLPRTEKAK
jgi:hypothetical protein